MVAAGGQEVTIKSSDFSSVPLAFLQITAGNGKVVFPSLTRLFFLLLFFFPPVVSHCDLQKFLCS